MGDRNMYMLIGTFRHATADNRKVFLLIAAWCVGMMNVFLQGFNCRSERYARPLNSLSFVVPLIYMRFVLGLNRPFLEGFVSTPLFHQTGSIHGAIWVGGRSQRQIQRGWRQG